MIETIHRIPPASEISGSAEPEIEPRLLELEARHDRLKAELTDVARQLRAILTASAVCPRCGSSGTRQVRGGLYGELLSVPCLCRSQDA
jgi:hypothetical protein